MGSACKQKIQKIKRHHAYSVCDILVPTMPRVLSNIVFGTEMAMIVVCASESSSSLIRKSHFLQLRTRSNTGSDVTQTGRLVNFRLVCITVCDSESAARVNKKMFKKQILGIFNKVLD